MSLVYIGKPNLSAGQPLRNGAWLRGFGEQHAWSFLRQTNQKHPMPYACIAVSYAHASLPIEDRPRSKTLIQNLEQEMGFTGDLYSLITTHAGELGNFAKMEGWAAHRSKVLANFARGVAVVSDKIADVHGRTRLASISVAERVEQIISLGKAGEIAQAVSTPISIPAASQPAQTVDAALDEWVALRSGPEQSRRRSAIRQFLAAMRLGSDGSASQLAHLPANTVAKFTRYANGKPLKKRGALNRISYIEGFLNHMRVKGVEVPVLDWRSARKSIEKDAQ